VVTAHTNNIRAFLAARGEVDVAGVNTQLPAQQLPAPWPFVFGVDETTALTALEDFERRRAAENAHRHAALSVWMYVYVRLSVSCY
jgi:hypothetical protein